MAASRVVLYFEKPEDAVQFTVAASSVISGDDSVEAPEALAKVGVEICKASRITTEDSVKLAGGSRDSQEMDGALRLISRDPALSEVDSPVL